MSPQQALDIRRMEFKQQMKERKELDKYLRKQARKDRLFSRPKGSFKSKKKKALGMACRPGAEEPAGGCLLCPS